MSRFNAKNPTTKKISYEGGTVYSKKVEDDWINFMMTSMMQPQFYESAEEQQVRFLELTASMLKNYGPEFVAKAAHYSRNVMGMRSISAMTAAILNKESFESKRRFFESYFRRPDDVAEVFAAVESLGHKPSHALVRGACAYLSKLDEYRLGKYKLEGKQYNMYDLINITHAHSGAIDLLKKGNLPTPDTWETRISACRSSDEKKAAWIDLVENDKLGYMALVRNLRNILQCGLPDSWVKDVLAPRLTNVDAIRKSMIFPYAIYCAWRMLEEAEIDNPRLLKPPLSKAFMIAAGNTPEFKGTSLAIIDCSGSMKSSVSPRSRISLKDISAVYAAQFWSSTDVNSVSGVENDLIAFGEKAKRITVSPGNNILDLIEAIAGSQVGGATYVDKVYPLVKRHYDRIFLFSDMQIADPKSCCLSTMGWGWNRKPTDKVTTFSQWFENYQKEFGKSRVYSFDLAGYSSQVVRTDGAISYMGGLNDKVFNFVEMIEKGRSLVQEIQEYRY